MISFRKLYNPETLKFRVEIVVGWRPFPLTGFWFEGYDPTELVVFQTMLAKVKRSRKGHSK